MNSILLREEIARFLKEDIGAQDLASEIIFSKEDYSKGTWVCKEPGIAAGLEVVKEGYRFISHDIEVTFFIREGEEMKKGQTIGEVEGPVQLLLSGERVMLNLFQRMSGIATLTAQAVSKLSEGKTRVCDTRKTTPGLRMFEKEAVRIGGGFNHRFGLHDAVMVKDNHIKAAGGISKAIEKVRKHIGPTVKVEVETTNQKEIEEAVVSGADIIMFDNFTPEEIERTISLVPSSILTEASGGISLSNLDKYSQCGVDFISMGCLTHSAPSLDISFNLEVKAYELS
ncbi:carboxylating nicotinate-nucleotide diphosphorylase [Bacillus sp. FJAT-44742]|uniref:carboxylating nicotinate-nucleotide diphosphorylase n=1 Tax=Bacillus sp. FJAT-44742 TaxID=2014005 RepID=UPI000C244137|nr:carboxylating nicotinate-nucleotide diphosphorylase [Bacillus sp. FJAT-44742]